MRRLARSLAYGLPLALAAAGCATTDSTDKDDADTDTTVDTDDTTVDTDTDTTVDTDDTDDSDSDDTDLDGWPATPDEYAFEAGTYLSTFTIPTDTDPDCCYDWGAASKNAGIDNGLSILRAGLGGFNIDIQAELDATIEAGSFVALLDHRDLPTADGTFTMAFFLGAFEDGTDYDMASMGTGEFLLAPTSFVAGTGRPQVVFEDVDLTDGHMTAQGRGFDLALSLSGINLEVPVTDVRMEGDVTVESGGVGIENGTLAGVIGFDDFIGAYNALALQTCGCSGLTGDLFTSNGAGGYTPNCRSAMQVADCTQPDESICETLVTGLVCVALPGLIQFQLDIDTNGSPTTYEALSVGLTFEGVPASVVGLEP